MTEALHSTVRISAHALDRFIERTKTSLTREGAEARFRQRHLTNARPLGGEHWYANGYIICVRDGVVCTVMKPDSPSLRRKVRRALKPLHDRLKTA